MGKSSIGGSLEVIRDRRPDASAILKIGPEEGVFMAMLADQFSSATIQAVEISQKACERASERLRPQGSRVATGQRRYHRL